MASGKFWLALIFVMALGALNGCGRFFVDETTDTGGGTGGTGTSNSYVYAIGSATNTDGTKTYTLSGYAVSTRKLTPITGLPITLPFEPTALAVAPSNSSLYVAGADGIYSYPIAANGTVGTGTLRIASIVSSMDISPDGKWLFALETVNAALDQFTIDTSTGTLSLANSIPILFTDQTVPSQAMMVRVSPSGTFIVAAMGNAGDAFFTLNKGTGAVAATGTQSPNSASAADNAVAFDNTSTYAYIARSGTGGGVIVYKIDSSGSPTYLLGPPNDVTNSAAYAVTLDSTGKYLYVADRTQGNINGYAIGTNSALTPLDHSPYESGNGVNSLALATTSDTSVPYVLAGASGGPDLTVYAIDTIYPGQLVPLPDASTSDTASTGVVAIATTHAN
ncbi:MAG: lactonase family protein [Acidobacteriaceae bacterium]|nr:lactonase family protein [Acidobacteriaceae bacterium]